MHAIFIISRYSEFSLMQTWIGTNCLQSPGKIYQSLYCKLLVVILLVQIILEPSNGRKIWIKLNAPPPPPKKEEKKILLLYSFNYMKKSCPPHLDINCTWPKWQYWVISERCWKLVDYGLWTLSRVVELKNVLYCMSDLHLPLSVQSLLLSVLRLTSKLAVMGI